MYYRLTKQGRDVRNTLLKAALWTTCATIVVRGCVGACESVRPPSAGGGQAAVVAVPPAPDPYAAWKDVQIGTLLNGPWRNTMGEPYVLYIGGARTVVQNGDLVAIAGVVVYDKRYKCKALRVEGEDSSGHIKPVYFFLSNPTPASFWDCTPDE